MPYAGGVFLGVSLLVNLGPHPGRQRFGVGIDGMLQNLWEPAELSVGPTAAAAVHVGWTHPVVFTEAEVSVGGLLQEGNYGGGYFPLIGARAGVGLRASTDGFVGPVVLGAVQAPLSEVRLEQRREDGAWSGTLLAVGPTFNFLCCTTEY